MPHVRAQVREKISAACLASGAVGTNVFKSRVYALNPKIVPAIAVYTEREDVAKANGFRNQTRMQDRKIKTSVYCCAAATDEVEDLLDDISLLVENQVLTDPTLGSLASETSLVSCEKFLTRGADGDLGVVKLIFESTVFTQEGNAAAKTV